METVRQWLDKEMSEVIPQVGTIFSACSYSTTIYLGRLAISFFSRRRICTNRILLFYQGWMLTNGTNLMWNCYLRKKKTPVS